MNSTLDKKSTSIRLQQDLYLYIKDKAKKSNCSLNSYIETLLLECSGFLEPNEKTICAINEIKNNKHILDAIKGQEELNNYLSHLKEEL